MLWEQAETKLADAEKKLVATEGEKKDQGLLLEMARQALSKREDSSVLTMLTAVANAMALLKSHLPILTWNFYARTLRLMKRNVKR
jgi:uncharacterized protein HemX